jgi:hypothetical protein
MLENFSTDNGRSVAHSWAAHRKRLVVQSALHPYGFVAGLVFGSSAVVRIHRMTDFATAVSADLFEATRPTTLESFRTGIDELLAVLSTAIRKLFTSAAT